MRVHGIKIRIHPTFIGLLILCVFFGLITRAFLVFALVILHELAHIAAARAYGVKVASIELYPYGGTAVLEDTFEGKRKEEAAIAFAGPAFNLLLVFLIQTMRWQGLITGVWTLELIKINFWLAAFNLLPVLPLDGGRLARAFLSGSFSFVKITKFLAAAGKWTGGFFIIFGFFMQALGYYRYEPAMFIILGIFIWLGGRKEQANARMVFLKQLCRKKEQLLSKGLLPGNCFAVSKNTPLGRVIDEFSPDRYGFVSVIGSENRIDKTLSETEIIQEMVDSGLDYKIGDI